MFHKLSTPHPPRPSLFLKTQVKVIHKWPRPLLPRGAVEQVPPPCLSWGPPQPSAARAHAPPMALLARGWSNSIQILAAMRVDAGGVGGGRRGGWKEGGVAGARVGWPSLAVVKELSASAPVVAVEWLGEQVWLCVCVCFCVDVRALR